MLGEVINIDIEKSIKKYSYKDNFKAFTHIILRLFYHVFFIFISFVNFNSGNYLFAILFIIPHFLVFSFLGWAGIGHELFHNTVFTDFRINKFLFRFFSILTWSNYSFFEITHWIHHTETFSKNDLESNLKTKIKPINFFWFLTFDLPGFLRRFYILTINSLGIIPKSLNDLFPIESQKRKSLIKTSRFILLFHFTIIAILLYLEQYFFIFAINLAPFFLLFINKILAIAQHFGVNNNTNDHFGYSRTVLLAPFLSFFYANMNYHVEHHLYPFIPFYNLPKVHENLKKKYIYKFYLKGFKNLFFDLKNLGCFN